MERRRTGSVPVPARMHFRPIKLKALIPYLSIAMIYPVISLITAEKKLLKFIDAMTITGVVFLILGIIGNLTRHGDFDITEYIARRSLRRGGMKSFAAFQEDKKEKRKNSANYPFLTGVILLAVSGVMSVLFF